MHTHTQYSMWMALIYKWTCVCEDYTSQWINEWMSEWLNEWLSECVSMDVFMSSIVSDCVYVCVCVSLSSVKEWVSIEEYLHRTLVIIVEHTEYLHMHVYIHCVIYYTCSVCVHVQVHLHVGYGHDEISMYMYTLILALILIVSFFLFFLQARDSVPAGPKDTRSFTDLTWPTDPYFLVHWLARGRAYWPTFNNTYWSWRTM